MEIHIDRKWKKDTYTISKVYVNGKDFGCNCLEDKDRGLTQDMPLSQINKIKVHGETAIPTGTYDVTITYSPRFKKNLPLLNNVPGYEGIRIHAGNLASQTEGCLLFGKNTVKGMVTDSKTWTNKIIDTIKSALDNKEKVTIKITN